MCSLYNVLSRRNFEMYSFMQKKKKIHLVKTFGLLRFHCRIFTHKRSENIPIFFHMSTYSFLLKMENCIYMALDEE